MYFILLMIALGGVAAIVPGRAHFLCASLAAVALYLFASNIPESAFGIEEFVRYTKEPIILSVILRFVFNGYFKFREVSLRNFAMNSARLKIPGGSYQLSLGGLTKNTKRLIVFVLLWSLMSLALTGLEGFLGYIRGIVFPVFFIFYLISIENSEIEKLTAYIGRLAVLFLLFLSASAFFHISSDPNFLITESFRNRLDYSASYQTLVVYDSVVRYQSFFGDPNRAALVFLISMWFTKFIEIHLLHIFAILVTIALVWLTESRTGMLIAVAWFSYQLVEHRRFKIGSLLVGAGGIAALVLLVIWSSHSTRSGAVEEVSRDIIWKGVVSHLFSSPHKLLIGEGFGWVGQSGGNRVSVDSVQLTSSSGGESSLNVIDNSYLTLLSSVGIVGLMPLVFLYGNYFVYLRLSCLGERQYRDILFLGSLFLAWSFTFDALVSFPWTFLFPILIRFYAVRK